MNHSIGMLVILLLAVSSSTLIRAANWDLNFDMTGFTRRTRLLVTDCSNNKTSVKDLINIALCGGTGVNCIEEPTPKRNKPHVTCVSDPWMGSAINLTLYKTDVDTGSHHPEQQRMEIKVFKPSPDKLKALLNSHFVYTYWFKSSDIALGKGFYHIFKLLPLGPVNNIKPVIALSLSKSHGLHLRIQGDDFKEPKRERLLPIHEFVNKWIQVRLEVRYKRGKKAGSDTAGFVKLTLKDQNGGQLYPDPDDSSETGQFYGSMFWKGTYFVRPKWGMHRKRSPAHNPSDWQLFQNIQIWSK